MIIEKESKNTKKIVIVGGGFGGIYTIKNLHKIFHNKNEISITLINKNNYFLFTPLLHEIATGNINPENVIEPIRKVLGCCVDSLVSGRVIKVDNINKFVITTEGQVPFDYLVLAHGAETNFYNIKGAKENSFTLKSLSDAIKIKNRCIDLIEEASKIKDREERKNKLRFVVVGGGPTGVELVSEMQEFLKNTFSKYYPKDLIEDISIILVHNGGEVLPQFTRILREKSLKILNKKGIKVLLNTKATEVFDDKIQFENGEYLQSQNIIWVAGIKPSSIDFEKDAIKDEAGRLVVNKFLELVDYPNIFCLGDSACFRQGENALPALAQVAVKQAKVVAYNIKQKINNKEPRAFVYKSSGALLSLGKWNAIGEVMSFVLEGKFAWWAWRTVYLSKMISWQKKIRVVVDWTINTFSARDISKL